MSADADFVITGTVYPHEIRLSRPHNLAKSVTGE